jgi:hypothetical protein
MLGGCIAMSESSQKEPAPEGRYLKKMAGIIKTGTHRERESFQVPAIVAKVGPTVFRVLYRSDPQQEHPNCVPSCDRPVLGLVSACRLSEFGRHRAYHRGGLHRAAPGLAADRQAAYGRDPDAVFLAHRKRNSGDESGPRGQDAEVFAPGG